MGGSPFKIEENVERILQYSETKKSLLQGGRGWGGNKRKKKKDAGKKGVERTMLDGGTPGLAWGFCVSFLYTTRFQEGQLERKFVSKLNTQSAESLVLLS